MGWPVIRCAGCQLVVHSPYKRCARCQQVYYCSRVCQRRDWCVGHRPVCSALVPALAAELSTAAAHEAVAFGAVSLPLGDLRVNLERHGHAVFDGISAGTGWASDVRAEIEGAPPPPPSLRVDWTEMELCAWC